MKKLLYFGNIPAPYTVKFLNELSNYFNVFALFERKSASDRKKIWTTNKFANFDGNILRSIKIKKEMGLSFGFLKYINQEYDYILIGNPLTPTGILAIYYLSYKKMKFGVISEGGMAGNGQGYKERFKKRLFSKASFYLSGSTPGNEYFRKYGAEEDNLYEYPFSSMYKNEILEYPISFKEKQSIKSKYNFGNQKIILSVGRIIESKGFDTLIKVAKKLPKYKFIIVGGKPFKNLIQLMKELEISNVIFVEHLSISNIREYYKMADVFVLPTRIDTYGLVINEAMSFGLPVITTRKCVAGIHLVKDGTNGYLVNVDDVKIFVEKIETLILNSNLISEIAMNNISKIKSFSIEQMAISVNSILKNLY